MSADTVVDDDADDVDDDDFCCGNDELTLCCVVSVCGTKWKKVTCESYVHTCNTVINTNENIR
jgi:hypothetical protein